MKKLEKTDALKKLKEDAQFSGDAQKALNEDLDKYKEVLQESADLEVQREEQRRMSRGLEKRQEGGRLTELEKVNAKEKERLEKRIEFLSEQVKLQTQINKLEKEEEKIVKNINDANDDRSEFVKLYGNLKQSESKSAAEQEIANAFSSAKANLISQIMKLPFPFNLLAAATAGDSIDKLFAKNGIKAAQYGADFVTDGPQMMMVGEGSGPERVQVTPLVDPNLDGPQGSGMTINIQGSVIGTEQFTEDVLMPQIEEGLRLGNRI